VTPAPERLTVADHLRGWLETVRPTIRATTFVSYEGHVRLHIVPLLGRIPLGKLTPADVRRLLAHRLEAGASPRSAQYTHAVLSRALRQAERDGDIRRNVAALVTPPRVRQHEISPLDPDQARTLLDAAKGDRLHALYAVATALGLRQGEALALRWQDTDLHAGLLRVTATLQRVPVMLRGPDDGGRGTRYRLEPPKTAKGRRTLPLPGMVTSALRDHRVRQLEERLAAGAAWQEWDLVFTTTIGTPLDARNVSRAFTNLLDRAGLPRIRFHDLRHSAATLMLAQGVDARTIMETLGHSQIGITMNTYAHVLPSMQREAADRMDAVLGDAR
jgi:integrase